MLLGQRTVPLVVTRTARGPAGSAPKRAFDILAATLLLVFFAPLLGLIALAVFLSDPGPVIFAHERLGFSGRTFRCLKFRSMVINSREALEQLLRESAEARHEWSTTQKLRNDPRITTFGRFLRETSLDELPQLINVLRGEMSLVGPRPIVSAEVPHYGDHIDSYVEARPGITGLWQVSGRSDCTYTERVQFDLSYVHDWSLALDLRILLRTPYVVLWRKGSR